MNHPDTIVIDKQGFLVSTDVPLSQQPAAVYLASLSQSSRRSMQTALDTIAQHLIGQRNGLFVDWGKCRFQHITLLRSILSDRYSAATVNRMLSALRGTLGAAWYLSQIAAEDYHRAISVKNIQGYVQPAGRRITQAELTALIRVCKDEQTPTGARDAAMIALLYSSGLRRAELARLRLSDYKPDAGLIAIQRGKGNKDRNIPVIPGAVKAIADWLDHRGSDEGMLFLRIRRGGHIQSSGLSAQGVYLILQTRAHQASIDKMSPHDLRRTFVSDLLDSGADLAVVQQLAGHESVATTARYDRRGETAKRTAAERLQVPCFE